MTTAHDAENLSPQDLQRIRSLGMRCRRLFGSIVSLFASIATTGAGLTAADLTFTEISRFNVASAGIGSVPSSVAWNGTRLFIGGYNTANGTATVGIVEVTNATTPGIVNGTFGTVFGQFAGTPGQRGFTGLDLLGSTLAASYDGGAAVANGVQAFNINTSNQLWGINARGSSGVAFDPGFGPDQNGSGTAWTTFGSGRRILQNNLNGSTIYSSADGMIINSGSGTNWRDIDFDSDTGDIYSRRSNGIFKGVRNGENSLSSVEVLKPTNAATDNINGQNLSYMNVSLSTDAIIYNDRTSSSSGQSFLSIIKAMNTSGLDLTTEFTFLSGLTPANSAGYYSFDFDPVTKTLAIADFSNRNVHIFAVVPEPSTVALGVAGVTILAITGWRRRNARKTA